MTIRDQRIISIKKLPKREPPPINQSILILGRPIHCYYPMEIDRFERIDDSSLYRMEVVWRCRRCFIEGYREDFDLSSKWLDKQLGIPYDQRLKRKNRGLGYEGGTIKDAQDVLKEYRNKS